MIELCFTHWLLSSRVCKMNSGEISDQEFYDEFVSSDTSSSKVVFLTQGINKAELVSLVAKASRYRKHEVEDVLNSLWDVINLQLEQGREIDIGGLFTARLYKPFPRRLYCTRLEDFRITDPRPRLKLVPTDMYQKYLWRGIHAPVNYFPPEKKRGGNLGKKDFTRVYQEGYLNWLREDKIRQQDKAV